MGPNGFINMSQLVHAGLSQNVHLHRRECDTCEAFRWILLMKCDPHLRESCGKQPGPLFKMPLDCMCILVYWGYLHIFLLSLWMISCKLLNIYTKWWVWFISQLTALWNILFFWNHYLHLASSPLRAAKYTGKQKKKKENRHKKNASSISVTMPKCQGRC